MSRTTDNQISGVEELNRTLKWLEEKQQRRIMGNAMNRTLTVIQKAIRAEAPRGNRTSERVGVALHKGIGKRVSRHKGKPVVGTAGANVKAKGSKRVPHNWLVIFGSVQRFTKTGANRGRMPANDFVGRGIAKSKQRAFQKMVSVAREQVAKLKSRG